jgi:osmotically-inducible protein OsmY
MRDYEDRYGRSRRDRDETQDYARREYEYRGSGGSGGYRQDMDYERGSGREYGQGRARDRGADFSGGMMDDMRRYARGDYDRDDDRSRGGYGYGYGHGGEDRSYGYERDRSMGERGYGGSDYGRDYGRGYGSGYGRERSGSSDWSRSDWSSSDRDRSGRNERGWLEKAGDEVASWFGDDDAERRRHQDEQRGHRGRGPRGYTRSDDRIREDVSDRLTDDPYVDASDIDITVNKGEVTLTGHVEHRSAKRRAEDLAESVSGATHVQNNLRVRQSTGMGTGMGSGTATSAGASAMAGMGGSGTGTTSPTTSGSGTTTGGTTATGGAASATTHTGDKMRT